MKKFIGLAAIFVAAPAFGQTIVAETTGTDNAGFESDYYSVAFANGGGFITSATWDISLVGGAFFDFDGGLSPVLGTLNGLAASDISFSGSNFDGGDPNRPATLTANFAAGAFAAGDSFTFGADTDFFVSDPAPGGVFGQVGAPFSVIMQGGGSGSAPFSQISATQSIATVVIPAPASAGLLGIAGLGAMRRRRR